MCLLIFSGSQLRHTQNNTDLSKYFTSRCGHVLILKSSSSAGRLAMRRSTPVIFAAQKQAQTEPGQVAAIGPVKDWHRARQPNLVPIRWSGRLGDRNAATSWSPACSATTELPLFQDGSAFRKGHLRGHLPLRCRTLPSSHIGKFETTKQATPTVGPVQ